MLSPEKELATNNAVAYANQEIKRLALSSTEDSRLLTQYWGSVLQSLDDLLEGAYEEMDGVPFVCYKSIDNTPVGPAFLDAWGSEIGRFGGLVHGIARKISDSVGGGGVLEHLGY